MAPAPEQSGEFYQIIGSLFAAFCVGAATFLTSYFKRKASEPAEEVVTAQSAAVVSRSVGAAFVDRNTADDIHVLREIAVRWEMREHAEELAELAELRRQAKESAKKDHG